MFERFTSEARRVVLLAQEEAREARDPCIDGTHLLLGIAAAGGPGGHALEAVGVDERRLRTAIREVGDQALDADALAALGIDLDRVRETAEIAFGSGVLEDDVRRRRRRRPSGHIPLTRTSKEALEQSLRAAIRRGDRAIDSRHLLLGLLAAREERTTAVLTRLGVDGADLRRRLEDDADAA